MDGGRVGFLDWGIINLNTPMREVSYFLTMAMNPDERRAHERDLLRHYLEVRQALGGSDIGWNDAWLAHRVHAAYTVPASCQVVTFPADASPAACSPTPSWPARSPRWMTWKRARRCVKLPASSGRAASACV